ncbi:hypothetical protein B296_00054563, partial [Ensete ventricosum]
MRIVYRRRGIHRMRTQEGSPHDLTHKSAALQQRATAVDSRPHTYGRTKPCDLAAGPTHHVISSIAVGPTGLDDRSSHHRVEVE